MGHYTANVGDDTCLMCFGRLCEFFNENGLSSKVPESFSVRLRRTRPKGEPGTVWFTGTLVYWSNDLVIRREGRLVATVKLYSATVRAIDRFLDGYDQRPFWFRFENIIHEEE